MSIKLALLALLLDEPRSASQLHHAFAETTEGVWPLNMGQVTQTLARLQRDGLIASAGEVIHRTGHTTETFELTTEGRSTVAAWWDSPVLSPTTERDELVTKVALAALRPEINLIRLLDEQRSAVFTELRTLNHQVRHLPEARAAERLLHERRIFLFEAQIRWLDRVEALADPTPTPHHESED